MPQAATRMPWLMIVCATVIMMITAGGRQTMGLFVAPLDSATSLGIIAISLAIAVGQLMWGVGQLLFGALADRYGPGRVILLGGLMMALGLALTPFVRSEWALIVTLGLLSAFGAGAGSFAILIGTSSQRIPLERRAFGVGIITSGSSAGQFIFAPVMQAIISSFDWVSAMLTLAATSLATLPLAWPLRRQPLLHGAPPAGIGLRAQLAIAFADSSYRWIILGFFTCGFHIAFLVTHLPGEVRLCGLSPDVAANTIGLIGLANIAGCLGGGWLGTRFRLKHLLFWLYLSRTFAVLIYLAAPKTELTFYIFAVVLGLSWLATVPPTAGLVGKLFGVRYLATLFGFAMLSHQVGGFLGAWLGGHAVARFGDYGWMFFADALLALMAAFVSLPVREAKMLRPAVA